MAGLGLAGTRLTNGLASTPDIFPLLPDNNNS